MTEVGKTTQLLGCLGLIAIGTAGPVIFKLVQAAGVPINTTTLVWLGEFGKLIFSLCAYYYTEGLFPSFGLFRETRFYYYAAPAIIYAIGNIAWAEVLVDLPASTAVVIVQLKLLFTAIVSRIFLNRQYKLVQWLALGIITAGAMGTQYSPDFTLTSAPLRSYAFVLANCLTSAFGGVVTEFLFKGSQQAQSLHFQNLQLYFWGIVVLLLGQLGTAGTPLSGINTGLLIIALSQVVTGLAVAWVIKFVDAVAKSICNALTLISTPLCGFLWLNESLGFPLLTSGSCVVMASILFSLLSY